jgi:hypothetical protein
MTDTIVISDRFRTPTTVQRREKGGLLVRQGGRYVVLDAAELAQVLAFVRDEEPQPGRIERFYATPPAAPPTDEPNWIE